MNSEDLQVQFKVIGTFGAPGHTSLTLGTYNCIREARIMVDTWKDDPQYKYAMFDELKIVKHSQVTLQTSKQTLASQVDYERQGVQTQTADFLELQDIVRHLEDRHVGLRHEVFANIDNLDEAMRHEVAGLRREVEDLREHLQQIAPVLYVTAKDEQWKS